MNRPQEATTISITIPISLKREIEAEANSNICSLSDEVVARLKRSFEYERIQDEVEQELQGLHARIEQQSEMILLLLEEKMN